MSDLIPIRLAEQACANLQAEIDLLKAGDAMLEEYVETGIIFPPSQDEWNAAKEGKQS